MQKSPISKNKLPQKFRVTRFTLSRKIFTQYLRLCWRQRKNSIEKRLENGKGINQKQNCTLLPFSVILLLSLRSFNHQYIFFFGKIRFSREHVFKSSLTLRNYAAADPLRFPHHFTEIGQFLHTDKYIFNNNNNKTFQVEI